jgi:outer membrane biosynthesis protein TonB
LRKKNVTAVLSGTISATGDFGELNVLNGDPAFTNIALDAVRQWRYSPPTQDGKAVDAKVYVVISADHGKVLNSVEPELPVPTQPHEPLKELFTSERLFRKKLGLALDRKAIDAVRTWKFEPATRDGEPVPVLINVEIMFRLY